MDVTAHGPPTVVVLGVSGSGKTTVGKTVAGQLGVPFLEGDDFHPPANIAKMSAGHPLDDADREPWLRALAERIRQSAEAHEGLVIACSALKRAYRDELRSAAGAGLWCLYLALDPATAWDRVSRRAGHFMPAGLVESQFATLEPLQPDEPGTTLDATADLPALLSRARAAVTGCDGHAGG
ncbi:gluconokinase [Streptomyces canus]|uniref:gluconokinase n=1 Tax=Streptomyces canus TaxID=58343 RepID=UPI00325002BB